MDELPPTLSEETERRMRERGLDPDTMSDEQLRAIESLENPKKSHWLVRPFSYVGGFLGMMALISIFNADWDLVFGYGAISLVLVYAGYRLQSKISSRQFVRATIDAETKQEEQRAKRIWEEFAGKKNSNDILVEKAKALGPLLAQSAYDDTKSLVTDLRSKAKREVKTETLGDILFETLFFYLHVIDRFSFQYLIKDGRDVFLDALVAEVREAVSRIYESGVEAERFRVSFTEVLNQRQERYGKYKQVFPNKDEMPKDTLFWEYGKMIAEVVGSAMDIVVIMFAQAYAVETMKALKLPKLLKES